MILIISNYYLETTLFLGLIICFLIADSLIFNFCANILGERVFGGGDGFFKAIGDFKIVEVAKVFNIFENFIILYFPILIIIILRILLQTSF